MVFVRAGVYGASNCKEIMSDMHLRACDMSCLCVTSRAFWAVGMVGGGQSLSLLLLTLTNENIWIRPFFDNAHIIQSLVSKLILPCQSGFSTSTVIFRCMKLEVPHATNRACRLLELLHYGKSTPYTPSYKDGGRQLRVG